MIPIREGLYHACPGCGRGFADGLPCQMWAGWKLIMSCCDQTFFALAFFEPPDLDRDARWAGYDARLSTKE